MAAELGPAVSLSPVGVSRLRLSLAGDAFEHAKDAGKITKVLSIAGLRTDNILESRQDSGTSYCQLKSERVSRGCTRIRDGPVYSFTEFAKLLTSRRSIFFFREEL